MPSLRALRAQYAVYGCGAWFRISKEESGIIAGRPFAPQKQFDNRPYVLIRRFSTNRPIVDSRPRSTTSTNGLEHDAHPPAHGCQIDTDGCIVNVLWPLSSDLIDNWHYTCNEPDAEITDQIKPRS